MLGKMRKGLCLILVLLLTACTGNGDVENTDHIPDDTDAETEMADMTHSPDNADIETGTANDFITTPMVATGATHTVVLRSDGSVWTWGSNYYGELGNGRRGAVPMSTPVQVQDIPNVTAIAAGRRYTVALCNDGYVWTWGDNLDGQLGDGTTTNRTTPVEVQGLIDVMAISVGGSHIVALKNDGSVWAWGANDGGRLGDGTSTRRTTPVEVQGLTNVTAIAAGGNQTVALRNDGSVWTWGVNHSGQLGDGTRDGRNTPVQVLGPEGIGHLNLGAK